MWAFQTHSYLHTGDPRPHPPPSPRQPSHLGPLTSVICSGSILASLSQQALMLTFNLPNGLQGIRNCRRRDLQKPFPHSSLELEALLHRLWVDFACAERRQIYVDLGHRLPFFLTLHHTCGGGKVTFLVFVTEGERFSITTTRKRTFELVDTDCNLNAKSFFSNPPWLLYIVVVCARAQDCSEAQPGTVVFQSTPV